jgi:hypothetical protein
METRDTVQTAAAQIVGQMSTEDREAIRRDGAESWREGISRMLTDEWSHIDEDELLGEVERLA